MEVRSEGEEERTSLLWRVLTEHDLAQLQAPSKPVVPFLHAWVLDYGEARPATGVLNLRPIRMMLEPKDYLDLTKLRDEHNWRTEANLLEQGADRLRELEDLVAGRKRGAAAELLRLQRRFGQSRLVCS